MWIKAVFYTRDSEYADRLADYFDRYYSDKVAVDTCQTLERASTLLRDGNVEVLLLGDEVVEDAPVLKDISNCQIAVISDGSFDGISYTSLAKYQSLDNICREVLKMYSEAGSSKKLMFGSDDSKGQKIIAFTSAGGGCGASTVARAFARKCAIYDKTLYFELDPYQGPIIASNAGNGMDEIIFALQSRRNILPVRIMSAVREESDRVYSFGVASNPADLFELGKDEIKRLIEGIRALPEYENVIIDVGNATVPYADEIFELVDRVICVSDAAMGSDAKYARFLSAMNSRSRHSGSDMVRKFFVFRNMVEHGMDDVADSDIGWAPFIQSAQSSEEIIDRIANSDAFRYVRGNHAT